MTRTQRIRRIVSLAEMNERIAAVDEGADQAPDPAADFPGLRKKDLREAGFPV